jgi:hypothetical protein
MERATAVLEHAPVGDLGGEGVLERVLEIRKEPRLVEKLGCQEVGERPAKAVFGHVGDGLQERERHVFPDDGGRLEQPLVLGRQPIDARRQDRLSRRRDRPRLERPCHPGSRAYTPDTASIGTRSTCRDDGSASRPPATGL